MKRQAKYVDILPGRSLRFRRGEEIGTLEDASDLDRESNKVFWAELERSYFMPVIKEILRDEERLNVHFWRSMCRRYGLPLEKKHRALHLSIQY